MKKIVLIGAGGHCKIIIGIIRSSNEYEIIGMTNKIMVEVKYMIYLLLVMMIC